jgi:hypothetical protein
MYSRACGSQAVDQPENVMCLGQRKAHVLHIVLHYYSFNNHWQLWTYGKKTTVLCYVVISVTLNLLLEQVNSLGTALILPKVCLKYQFSYQYQKYSLVSKFMWKESHWNYQNFWGKEVIRAIQHGRSSGICYAYGKDASTIHSLQASHHY